MNWHKVAKRLDELAAPDSPALSATWSLNEGQRVSLRAIGGRLPENGVLIADEVGMGKTRIAVAVARAVIDQGGRVAVVVPPGLGYQWHDELRCGGVEAPLIVRSLWQYLAAWEPEDPRAHRPWARERVVLISHAFTNWRLGEASQAWRWALLPVVYAHWRRATSGRLPRGYWDHQDLLKDLWVQRAAESIVEMASGNPGDEDMQRLLAELVERTPWPAALEAGQYARQEALRPWLEQAVGLGLGFFDLVIIDEAHKSRAGQSGLSRLLNGVVQRRPRACQLALTATPVELDAGQWAETLGRIGADGGALVPTVRDFAEAVRRVRHNPTDPESRRIYLDAARTFEQALTPYVLRRDKREDVAVQDFHCYSGLPLSAYRDLSHEIAVDPSGLSGPWKQCLCAAEALSLVVSGREDPVAKRLRLTLGSGHGIAALIAEVTRTEADAKQDLEDGIAPAAELPDGPPDKRTERALWWQQVMVEAIGGSRSHLFDHPAIRAAVEAIEAANRQGEKVLVFGRFTRPMQDLVDLLNAREMLRCLEQGRAWSQAKVAEDEWPAVAAAQRQLGIGQDWDRTALDTRLEEQYARLERLREQLRRNLIEQLHQGLNGRHEAQRAVRLFTTFRLSIESAGSDGGDHRALVQVARALLELLPESVEPNSPEQLAEAFGELVEALCDRDEGDADGDGELDPDEASTLWALLETRLVEEYGRTQGRFARLMYGGTAQETRRMLQLSFNRQHSFPRVLVAQSMVGREGLNLHRACRIVVLLHPEWNPGVVEQQIGRVDRVGSHWENSLRQAIAAGCLPDALPRIEVRPVIFQGTYDEQNWAVLRQRWDDLRAQLHGVIIPPQEAAAYQGLGDLINEINEAAPNFSPLKSQGQDG
jgi:hypothetical protein